MEDMTLERVGGTCLEVRSRKRAVATLSLDVDTHFVAVGTAKFPAQLEEEDLEGGVSMRDESGERQLTSNHLSLCRRHRRLTSMV